jgi:hypothetical protein
VNFVYSLAFSNKEAKPSGVKVKGAVLAEALRKAGLRGYLGSRMTRHGLADAAEALLVYGRLNDHITLDDCVEAMRMKEDAVKGLSDLLAKVKERATFP